MIKTLTATALALSLAACSTSTTELTKDINRSNVPVAGGSAYGFSFVDNGKIVYVTTESIVGTGSVGDNVVVLADGVIDIYEPDEVEAWVRANYGPNYDVNLRDDCPSGIKRDKDGPWGCYRDDGVEGSVSGRNFERDNVRW